MLQSPSKEKLHSWAHRYDSPKAWRLIPIQETRKSLPKAAPCPRQAGHHRTRWHAGNICDLPVGHPFKFAQNQDFTKAWRELLQRLSHQHAAVVSQRNLFWIRGARIGRENLLV